MNVVVKNNMNSMVDFSAIKKYAHIAISRV